MPEINSSLNGVTPPISLKQVSQQGLQTPVLSEPAEPLLAQAKAIIPKLQRQPALENLLDPEVLETPLSALSAQQIQAHSALLPRPSGLQLAEGPLAKLSDQDLIDTLMKGENGMGGKRFGTVLRTAEALEMSGVLNGLRQLASRDIQVPASEYDRHISDDAVLVMKGFAKMSPQQIAELKEQAYHHPEREPDLQGAIDKKYYGSADHKQFGALVESLTGGVLSAEEAMAMCPCGGIPGPGPKEIPLARDIPPVARHAMRHDALGFLLTRFGVGPGYGSKTTIFGRNSDDPMAGQVLGIARETFKESSVFPPSKHVAKPERFKN
jgi:hypothetical protein